MRRKLCLGCCSLAGSRLYLLLLAGIPFPFWIYNSFMSQKNIVFVTKSLVCRLSQASCFSDQLSSTCCCLPLAVVGLIVLSLA